MPHTYRLANPGVTSISHGGREFKVNGDGLLEVPEDGMNTGLHNEITHNHGGMLETGNDEADRRAGGTNAAIMSDEEIERATLFSRLDTIYGNKIDRRRSVKQLRDMLAAHEKKQAGTVGASQTPVNQPPALQPPGAEGGSA
jgi:hypothetical protein